MEPLDRTEVVTACRTAYDLASSPEVAAAWEDESACAGMTVGGLTHHLLGQARHIAGILGQPPTDHEPIPLLDHYARADWVTSDAEDEANTSIRDGGNDAATAGRDAVLAEVAPLLDRLPQLLRAPREPDTMFIPWQGWALTTDDFLVTRAMELVVHSDDLAASVGLPTPDFPGTVAAHVVDLLGGVAMRRHGQSAVIRALSRPQRAPESISAF
ncbi:maleylpyruvate isomerase N-terminal domain-containing protein [Aeromicrobium sp. NPDC092404]|uniref:maleylpyruvate isomerase N-terminal domain-containing protein n=1 Tax=Aeromicrobium sp. NPDC092404 TaxID=3154976 RepID=UPI003415294A